MNYVQPSNNISFGSYQSELKTLFKKGKLPSVTHGLYGDKLTVDNVSLEHLKPASMGGKSTLSNFALASKIKNNARGNKPLNSVLNWSMIKEYLDQFLDVHIPGKFDGNQYIRMIKKTVADLGVEVPKKVKGKKMKHIDFLA